MFRGRFGLRHVDQVSAHIVHGDGPVGGQRRHRITESLEVRTEIQRILCRPWQRQTALLRLNCFTAQYKRRHLYMHQPLRLIWQLHQFTMFTNYFCYGENLFNYQWTMLKSWKFKKYFMTRSIAQSLCDSWASCTILKITLHGNELSLRLDTGILRQSVLTWPCFPIFGRFNWQKTETLFLSQLTAVKKFLNWLRTSCMASMTTPATWHTRTADFSADFEQHIINRAINERQFSDVTRDSI